MISLRDISQFIFFSNKYISQQVVLYQHRHKCVFELVLTAVAAGIL